MSWRHYFKNKVVWVTGASSGIGERLCYLLGAYGAKLILSARNAEQLGRVADAINQAQGMARVLPLDLERTEELPDKVRESASFFGPIDILVNNAGLAVRDYALATHLDIDRKIMAVNYFGPVALTKAILPEMLARDTGQIVVVSSLSAIVGIPRASAYAAAKHALHGFFDSLRSETTSPNVYFTILVPGIIQTEITAHALKGDGSSFGRVELSYQKAYPAEQAAEDFARAIARRKQEKFVGGTEGLLLLFNRLSPMLTKSIIRNHPLKRIRQLKHLFSGHESVSLPSTTAKP